ncbi:MAG: VWA domain-containing protein [Haliscomenobacter sp.]|nr:VWA domain-containing protein [Haliscomenobacter sp.]MBK7475276.1 VWA domain-containing protein [Haliscomenobacter sp.]MBK8879816.1 VWA domain-containing protein [Haliscomenobacter sp.]
MFRFEEAGYLYFFVLLAVPVVLFVLSGIVRRRRLARFGAEDLAERLMPGRSIARTRIKLSLWLAGLTLLVGALANPQWGTKREAVKSKGIDLFLALDLSQSMLAEDLAPNRLARGLRFSQDLVEAVKGNRIGLILFAGNAYLQIPLTADYAAVGLFLQSAHPSMLPDQGTAIGEALALAGRSFPRESKSNKAVVIISDGENHEEDALREARAIRSNGAVVFTVGVGTTEGSFIPFEADGQRDYKRDETGAPVRSALNESMLKELARAGDGAYYNLSSGAEPVLEALRIQLDRIEKREMEQRIFSEYESYFQLFLGIAFLFFILEMLIGSRRKQRESA